MCVDRSTSQSRAAATSVKSSKSSTPLVLTLAQTPPFTSSSWCETAAPATALRNEGDAEEGVAEVEVEVGEREVIRLG